jgi:predicted transcriptional regulator
MNKPTPVTGRRDTAHAKPNEAALDPLTVDPTWQTAAIEEGIRAADAGRVIPHEDVAAWVLSWSGPNERPMPRRR